jgi:hypothetical protein
LPWVSSGITVKQRPTTRLPTAKNTKAGNTAASVACGVT